MTVDEQRMAALARGNERRIARSRCRARMKGMKRPDAAALAVNLIGAPPEWARTWRVASVLQCIPAIGPTKAATIIRRAGVDGAQSIASLTPGKRAALIDALALRISEEEASADV